MQQSVQYPETYDCGEHEPVSEALRPVQISTLGGLTMRVHGKDIGVQSWKSPKVYQLLTLIVAMGGRNIATYHLCDAIWPDDEGDKGMQNLEFILRRLRQVIQPCLGADLQAMQVIQLQHGKISLNADYCDMDIWHWERLCAQARILRMQGDQQQSAGIEHQAASILAGSFLAGDDALELLVARRSIWHDRICGWIDSTVQQWRDDDQFERYQSEVLLRAWHSLDPYSERLCMQRMRLLLDEGYVVDARRVYHQWAQLIKNKYDLKPSQKVIDLARSAV